MSTYGDYGSYGSYGSTGLDSLFGAAIGLLIFALIIGLVSVVFVILMLIGQWKSFKKAGYKGWEALIAGHNSFVNCTFAGINPIWVLFLVFGSVLNAIPFIGFLCYLGLFGYYQVVLGISTAKAFGKGTGFGIALAIPVSAPIAWFILGGKNVQYIGKNPCNDPIMGMFDKNGNNNQQPNQNQYNNNQQFNGGFQQPMNNQSMNSQPMNNQPQVKFCTGCGYKVTNGERFCPGCGKEML